MTICVAVKVHDCLVFAADSAMSLDVGDETVNVYAHGNKVFNLVKGLPVCAMFCGMGNIGRSSISSLAKDLRRELSCEPAHGGIDREAYTIEDIATRAKHLLFDRHYQALDPKPTGPHSLEFFVGGYSADADMAEVWKIILINGECVGPLQQQPGSDGAYVLWAGQPEALNRLILGYSQFLPSALLTAGVEPEKLADTINVIRAHTVTPLAEDPMPTGDAIALADFLVDVTKRYVHFLRGADNVGGDTDIATVTRHEGFRWIRRKHFYPRDLNLETDHV
ncbi:hypothetical protein D9601_10230 [Sphingomonas sp. MA1305]|uniref:hypothetical protein n=1 Tax=Sphingomonas sp. MA1305 TaxID=2479204 RepID=UPI0018E0591E|nr:hypothetical protein [Sphingomonas sp. MA1305]MBI0475728.1 hypothetical protein [Sphingomonas sp. MA1305]